MKEILKKYCSIVGDYGNCILYEYDGKQGFQFLYVDETYVEFRMGISAMVYHAYRDKDKLRMLFDSWK